MNEQHDDHIWLTVNGEGWAIYKVHGSLVWLWRGYAPNLEYSLVSIDMFNADAYCDTAVKLLYETYPMGNSEK